MQKKKEQAREELYGDLGRLFDFTRGDLEANRAGFMSKRQKQSVSRALLIDVLGAAFCLIVLFAYITLSEAQGGKASEYVFPVGVIIVTMIIWYFLPRLLPKIHDRMQGEIASVSGPIVHKSMPVRNKMQDFLEAGPLFFPVSGIAAKLKWKNSAYTLYYLPASKKILSIGEALPEEEAV